MSYIIKSSNPFASTKLTEKGREKLSKGQLTFNSWAIGDSEINYTREVYVDDATVSGTTKVLRPKDRQPDLKYFINSGGATPLVAFGAGDVRCIKAVINNEADERGFFTGNLTSGYESRTDLTGYFVTLGVIDYTVVSGGTTLNISGLANGATEGDLILLKIGYSGLTNTTPTPHLWYKIQSIIAGNIVVDRTLPTLTSGSVTYMIYKGGEIYDNEPDAISYWDTGTLAFDSSCDITTSDVPVWNMNNVYSEDILGITGTTEYEKHINFGSYDYLGQKNNYLYDPANGFKQAIGVIHYTNKTISNLYGEFFFIDSGAKTVKLHMPDIMYHRRNFTGSTTGDKMGMSFIASGATTSVGINGLNYVNLIEDPTLIEGIPSVVGRVYPDLKIVTIDNPELLAVMSYKSNRNWTLPRLNLTLANPSGGVGTGTLSPNETMYVTYSIDNSNGIGITSSLPCQNYATIINSNTTTKDVQFNINDIDLLPYMRDNSSGDGFYGNTFKVIYQKTIGGARPTSNGWKVIDFSSSVNGGGAMVLPLVLETQNPLAVTPILQIGQINNGTASTYSVINTLSMAPTLSPEILQFGDERFFYGNVEAFIGATIFKTLFKITINASNFNQTTNITRSNDPTTNPPTIRATEVGIYDASGDLVIISKFSKPINLTAGNTIMVELSMDF
jgi:hypothetical protein